MTAKRRQNFQKTQILLHEVFYTTISMNALWHKEAPSRLKVDNTKAYELELEALAIAFEGRGFWLGEQKIENSTANRKTSQFQAVSQAQEFI